MNVCPKCGFRDNPHWRHSRFDFNADYMRFDEAQKDSELAIVTDFLNRVRNFVPFQKLNEPNITYYRRGKGGLWLYRVATEDFKVHRERKDHHGDPNQTRLLEAQQQEQKQL